MKFSFLRSMFVIMCVSMCLFSLQASAEVNIAVVDIDKILAESKAAKSIQSQVDTKRKAFLSEVKGAEDALRKEQKAIEKQRDALTKDELVKKAREFEKRRIEARNSIQTKKAALDNSYSQAMNTLTQSIFEVCHKIANEDKIDLIITRQNIIVGSMSLDITAKVMERLNKGLTSLKLEAK